MLRWWCDRVTYANVMATVAASKKSFFITTASSGNLQTDHRALCQGAQFVASRGCKPGASIEIRPEALIIGLLRTP